MKKASVRLGALVVLTGVALFLVPTRATAGVAIGINVGVPPPAPPVYVGPPAPPPPYYGAVWIQPHYEWIGGRWIWQRGYYGRPPYRGARWVPGYYRHGYYRHGYWR
ncbi:MAG: hypothetical protein WDO13_16910 [Verrucomicrobiota bacterium]